MTTDEPRAGAAMAEDDALQAQGAPEARSQSPSLASSGYP